MQSGRIDSLTTKFVEVFGNRPSSIFRAPGRVELIGNHTDYNGGYVMAAAIDRDVLVAAGKALGSVVTVHSMNFNETDFFGVAKEITSSNYKQWANYVRGVADQLVKAGVKLPGMELVIEGNVPLGGGLSSSAAIEVATAIAMLNLAGHDMSGEDVAHLCQRVENDFVGVSSGIMDQFLSRLGKKGQALFLDCRSLKYEHVSLPSNTKIVVADTGKPRTLAGSEYNVRREQCEQAVATLSQFLPDIRQLRDVSVEQLEQYADKLDPLILMRARHVVYENQRVLDSVTALRRGDREKFGQLLTESHNSSRDLYENSSKELDWLVSAAVEAPGCLGSRLSGAGFGGCTVSIVISAEVPKFIQSVFTSYSNLAGAPPDVFVLEAAEGAERLV